MTLVKYRPNRNMFFQKGMNHFFDDFLTKDWAEGNGNFNSQPKVNILDKSDQYEIHFATPGMNKSDFNISPLRWGVTARVGYKWFGIYANYYMTSLFKPTMGPELYPFAVGIAFTW